MILTPEQDRLICCRFCSTSPCQCATYLVSTDEAERWWKSLRNGASSLDRSNLRRLIVTVISLKAELEQARAALGTISRTIFSGDEMNEDYMRGNRAAHVECARWARIGLGAPQQDTEPKKDA